MDSKEKIRVILADGLPLAIAGARYFLAGVDTIDVVGTARNSGEVVEVLDRSACDILVSDYIMPAGKYGDGLAYFAFLRRRFHDLKIIAYTAVNDPSLLAEMARLGVRSVVGKTSEMEQLAFAIETVFAGQMVFPEPGGTGQGDSRGLSAKEVEVVRLFASGFTADEISRKICRSRKTVSSHKANAKQKLGIKSDAGLFSSIFMPGLFAATI
ncbi:response regulator transcription factor [Paraburkholderia sp. J11-2]|uniref:response regulator transcription factor n=1 Tax=Paraburkholderia sp. J11-2 TaxID=2805431 RepID=UPI002AB7180C|nr:response regulator transcription factor [Paraburkholderia sp. J11-2]